jgi:chaperone BCS1
MDVNSSVNISSFLGPSLADFYLSGFSLICHLFSTYLYIDVSSFIPPIVLLSAVTASLGLRPSKIATMLGYCFMCSVEISSDDEVFDSIDEWLSETQKFGTQSIAKTGKGNDEEEHVSKEDNSRVYIMPRLSFTPAGLHWIWYRRWLIVVIRKEKRDTYHSTESLYLKCFGWNDDILRTVIHEARLTYAERDKNNIVVYHAQSSFNVTRWTRTPGTSTRDPSTVVLHEDVKGRFINDVREYLHPETRCWYAQRGIPYRRGYLFYGPPGTGKTSLCCAAASVFALKIYILGLTNLNEETLYGLIASLPRRCILLLEDADANEVTKARTQVSSTDSSNATREGDATLAGSPNKRGITLSSLLNAIDGVAAAEGRVLVLTTNRPESLDPALTRPGRIDVQIEFGPPDYDHIKALFLMIYSIDDNCGHRKALSSRCCPYCSFLQLPPASTPESIVPRDRLERLANKFAASLAGKNLSQATIQGFLVVRRKVPELAVEEAPDWAEKETSGRNYPSFVQ